MTFRWNCIAAGLRGSASDTRLCRFPSGTVGFIAPGDVSTAVCMAYDTHLRLEGISQVVQNACGVMADEDVTFTRLGSANSTTECALQTERR